MTIHIPLRISSQVRGHFTVEEFQRGAAYAREGRVHLANSTWPAVARVRGEGRNGDGDGNEGYVTTVHATFATPGEAYVRGECSCGVDNYCAHVAATALVALTRDEDENDIRSTHKKQILVGDWLSRLSFSVDSSGAAPEGRYVVAYVIVDRRASERTLGLEVQQVSRLKRGGFSRGTSIASVTDPFRTLPSWIAADDLRVIAMLRATGHYDEYARRLSMPQMGAELLQILAATGRLFWNSTKSLPLGYGPSRAGRLRWRETPEAAGEFRVELDAELVLLPGAEIHYLDSERSLVGPLEVGIPAALVLQLLRAPPVPRSMLDTVQRSLEPLLGSDAASLLLDDDQDACAELVPVRPHLLLRMLAAKDADRRDSFVEAVAEAVYSDDKGDEDQRFVLGRWDAERPEVRDMVEEGRLLSHLTGLLDDHREDYSAAPARRALSEARYVAHVVVPRLTEEGWTCVFDDDFPVDLAAAPTEWIEELCPRNESYDWFSLELGVVIRGRTVPLLPILLAAIRKGELSLDCERFEDRAGPGMNLELPDGDVVYVSGERLQRWLRPLMELQLRGLDDHEDLLLPSVVAVELASTMPGRFAGGAALEAARQRVAELLDLEMRVEPESFGTELRGYQRKGLAWLRFLHDAGYGGLLADDMGLGKTVQVLAFLAGLLQVDGPEKLCAERPVLVVAPRSVVGHWASEAQRFTPGLQSLVHMGPRRARDIDDLLGAPLIITTFQTMRLDIKLLSQVAWTSVIFDEAQFVKNPEAKVRKAAGKLEARSRFCITGTPIENHLGELWSQIDLVMPGLLGNRAMFSAIFRTPIEKHGSTQALELLRQRIRPFMLRRTKDRVELDLPDKIEIVERVNFDTAQRDLYESMRLSLAKEVKQALADNGLPGSSLTVLDALLKLRQVCCHPALVKTPQAQKVKASAKLERLMSMLEELADTGRFVLVFSQFTSMLEQIEVECRALKIRYLKLTGATRNREQVVRAFQAGQAPVFLISLKAGGTGLNLTRADTVIHYDPWWNPAAEDQATDRAHRIGQDKKVFVYKLISNGTLEERIIEMQSEKRALTDAALRDGGVTHLSKIDLDALYRRLV